MTAEKSKPPRSTFWPAILALAITLVVLGLVTSRIVLGFGVLLFAVAMTGWIREIRAKKIVSVNCPCRSSSSAPDENSRRKFLAQLSLAAGGIGALMVTVPTAGFILAPFFKRKNEVWRSVGKVDAFKVGETIAVQYDDASPLPWAGTTARSAAWLRRLDTDTFIAFSINCTHLGCPVRWIADSELFMCPCHGGVYYKDGEVAAGPPPLPLPRYPVRVSNDEVQILTSPIPIGEKNA